MGNKYGLGLIGLISSGKCHIESSDLVIELVQG